MKSHVKGLLVNAQGKLALLVALLEVFAITDKSKGTKGISAFIVERDRPGVSVGKEEDKMGIRLSNTTEVVFAGWPDALRWACRR